MSIELVMPSNNLILFCPIQFLKYLLENFEYQIKNAKMTRHACIIEEILS